MKVGDLIIGDPDEIYVPEGYDIGLIVEKKRIEFYPAWVSNFRVMWRCGKVTSPSDEYLRTGFRVVE
jgi:hypothetical protein